MQMNEITSREVFFTAVFEAGISICKTSVHTCWCRVQADSWYIDYVEAAALRRTDGRMGCKNYRPRGTEKSI